MKLATLFTATIFILPSLLHAQPGQLIQEESEGVTLGFEKSGDEDQVKAFQKGILPEVKSALEALNSDLGTGKVSGAKIFIFSPETYHKKFPQTVDTRIPAFFNGQAVYIRGDNDITYALRKTIRHELTHLVLNQNYGKIPAWLNEGLAVYEERQLADASERAPNHIEYNTIFINKQDSKMVPFDQLASSAIFNRQQGIIPSGDAYTTAFVAVYELIQKSGMESMRGYLAAIGKGKNWKDEMQAQFGLSYDKINEYLAGIAAKKS